MGHIEHIKILGSCGRGRDNPPTFSELESPSSSEVAIKSSDFGTLLRFAMEKMVNGGWIAFKDAIEL
jgi:hypothetical protein